jgi:pyruvate dehydrogenase E1 component beta subunit
LRVVMPATPADARDLLIASVLSDDPVLYIDDRWLYGVEQEVPPVVEKDLRSEFPGVLRQGGDCTLVGSGYSTQLCLEAADILEPKRIMCEVIDLRVINPLDFEKIISSVYKTGRLAVVDGGWRTCGLAGEVVAGVVERLEQTALKASPIRITLPDAPAPTSRSLEAVYYPTVDHVVEAIHKLVDIIPARGCTSLRGGTPTCVGHKSG